MKPRKALSEHLLPDSNGPPVLARAPGLARFGAVRGSAVAALGATVRGLYTGITSG